MGRILFLIGAGGAIGSISRYLVTVFFSRHIPSVFPYGTFVVNLSGCLFIGILYALAERFSWLSPEWRLFLTTGLCGGYTTFSTFMYENMRLLQQGHYLSFAAYSLASFALGLLGVILGAAMVKA